VNAPRRHCERLAFTLVELLVVVAIIGALVAILLPAVQSARESARRAQCASQIKQLALAALNYESAHGALPPAGIAEVRPEPLDDSETAPSVEIFNPYGGLQFSWIVMLLPQLEQAALHARFDLTQRVDFQKSNAQAESIAVLVCPSDGPGRGPYREFTNMPSAPYKNFAKGNYAAYTSPFHVDLQMLYRGAFIAGGQALSAIEDGASNTLALAEVRTLDRDEDRRGVWAASWPGSTLLSFDMHPMEWQHEGGVPKDYVVSKNAPYTPNPESLGKTQTPNCQGPNRDTIKRCAAGSPVYHAAESAGMPCLTIGTDPGLKGHMSAAPRSLHPGGVNGAYLDGRVLFLTDDVDEFVMARSVSIDDGQSF
jgi:prepilin-type N-terminal cleavage/methylation domain-containing protein/prepilin-type processing-associated H-X9-DG protein